MEKYRLVGIMNMFDIVPDFVMPIFENNNKLYFQIGKMKTLTITEFTPVKESAIKHVILFDKLTNNLRQPKKLTLEDDPLFSFQTSKNYVFIGTYEEMKEYLLSFETTDEKLIENIEDFLNKEE